ncbi:hypothetical protein CR513_60445, partial [Mucuna pruriens]
MERFPHLRKSKLNPRGGGPCKNIKKTNNNAYKVEMPQEYQSTKFEVKFPSKREDNTFMGDHTQEGKKEIATLELEGHMTRGRLKRIQEEVHQELAMLRGQEKDSFCIIFLIVNGLSKAEFVKKLHEKEQLHMEKKGEKYVTNGNKGRKEVLFKEGDLVLVHLRKERFPHLRKSKLLPRGDDPFKILKRINNNAYKFGGSTTFNVIELTHFVVEVEDDAYMGFHTQGSQVSMRLDAKRLPLISLFLNPSAFGHKHYKTLWTIQTKL